MYEFAIIDALISFIFSIQCIILVFVLIGAYASLWYGIDNFKSVVKVIRSILVPYFQPQEDVGLSEKFGQWAGTRLILWFHFYYFMILPRTFECNKTLHGIRAQRFARVTSHIDWFRDRSVYNKENCSKNKNWTKKP